MRDNKKTNIQRIGSCGEPWLSMSWNDLAHRKYTTWYKTFGKELGTAKQLWNDIKDKMSHWHPNPEWDSNLSQLKSSFTLLPLCIYALPEHKALLKMSEIKMLISGTRDLPTTWPAEHTHSAFKMVSSVFKAFCVLWLAIRSVKCGFQSGHPLDQKE